MLNKILLKVLPLKYEISTRVGYQKESRCTESVCDR